MGGGDMMGRAMKGRSTMGVDAMGPPIMFRMMDSDGDGAISSAEFQAAHERIFKAMDSNKDGKLTPEEMRSYKPENRLTVRQTSYPPAGPPSGVGPGSALRLSGTRT
ncbi:hypothetical protein BDHH15_53800 [Bradyrhizobium diazoefficiens]|uniref:EF-hand domain-containing protein n=3 Tax=Bradyrhizobium diazoefficiens TaxID=1355477 RepID=A0A810C7Z0_9BRAD|nr:hypothetical protein BDHH15_53800 [Bradyrhizobium diazoefficiens]BCE31484.1 hypothetical protein XF2B_52530 [Bradyrhizobium diazoefficiens]BCE40326.1 hypothetical protein XF3B_53570 [Bradyrhizobium diazoefficiens]BCE83855.1 hypothetical protein XF9B_52760 [Bradyrhizobium diazoefficiens]BCF01244.1 hypothetical protein XF11B_52640 [Bradyrhizobium diazoefficiens]